MIVVFATSRVDALSLCKEKDFVFEDVVWVLNDQLLGQVDDTAVVPYYSDLFMEMPAYQMAHARFGDEPVDSAD